MNDVSILMQRFPNVELSYETHHKKASSEYDVAVAIPYGKKAFMWCTYNGRTDDDAWILLELGRDRKVVKAQTMITANRLVPWSFGTVLYGVVVNETAEFVVEDILQCRGILCHKQTFGEKLAFFKELAPFLPSKVWLPRMQNLAPAGAAGDQPSSFTRELFKDLPYVMHHVQYRSLSKILPYVNVSEESGLVVAVATVDEEAPPKYNVHKPQYKKPSVFEIRADVQNDIYRLYTHGGAFYGLAYIPNYKTSVFMNSLFRNIAENRNLDALEESDDEEDFQDCRPNKYVDLEKRVNMECMFHSKFKRWVPVAQVSNKSPLVSLTKL